MTPHCRRGFSLIELLMVIGLIGMILGLFLPAVQHVRAAAARTACLSNMRQLGLAAHHYEGVHQRFPPTFVEMPRSIHPTARYGAQVTWRAPLTPYLEREELWRQTIEASRLDPIAYHNPPHTASAEVVKPFVCPVDSRLSHPLYDPISKITAAYTSYTGVGGTWTPPPDSRFLSGVFDDDRRGTTVSAITDGLSNTVMIGERPPPESLDVGWWYSFQTNPLEMGGLARGVSASLVMESFTTGYFEGCFGPFSFGPGRLDNPCDRFHFWSLHPGGANFAFADGSARFLRYSARPIMAALATRAGGETVAVE